MNIGQWVIIIASFAVATLLVACASTPKVSVSPTSAPNQEKLEADTKECLEIAKTYDLGKEKKIIGAILGGGVAGAGAGALAATTVLAPQIALIVGATALGGWLWGGKISKDEMKARENILAQCLKDRGYEVYSGR